MRLGKILKSGFNARLARLSKKIALLLAASMIACAPSTETKGLPLTEDAPDMLTVTTKDSPLSLSPVIKWRKNVNAVSYELELFDEKPSNLDSLAPADTAIFTTKNIYSNIYNIPLFNLKDKIKNGRPLWWRVRVLGIGGNPLSPFSETAPLYTSSKLEEMHAPIPEPIPKSSHGGTLLYPVYSWVRPSESSSFEIEIYSLNPESNPYATPLDTYLSPIAEFYDPLPRLNENPFYWRVRSLDDSGKPIGTWSSVASFTTSPNEAWDVAVYGDSISHGGGHLSFGPEDLEYSWLTYLDFPSLNLSQSGNVTGDLVTRFDADVVPFHPKYLLVMCGTNDLRSEDFTVKQAIMNTKLLIEKCMQNDVKPIFLTLPPINPGNIERAFDEPTDPAWQKKFLEFNEFLRTVPHIDVARSFAAYSAGDDNELPEWLGLDGLHEDVLGKRLIAARVNADWEEAKEEADKAYTR
ncbi:MAG: GDSL family lipase [Schwartzia sp.]|nr:GDSL family lipase [Schwartzia sp. (in: firmicutes)]